MRSLNRFSRIKVRARRCVMAENRFPKRLRLLGPNDFERVFAARNSASNRWIMLHGCSNEAGHARIGLAISRRVGRAVERNRWKRLLREAFRLAQQELPAVDLVCLARAEAPPPLGELQQALISLSERISKRMEPRPRACEEAK
jgi:ribonuclease P protein component